LEKKDREKKKDMVDLKVIRGQGCKKRKKKERRSNIEEDRKKQK
jgi:hypothetical protein